MPSALFAEILADQKRARTGLPPIAVTSRVTESVTNVTSEDLRDILEGITELVTMVTALQARVEALEGRPASVRNPVVAPFVTGDSQAKRDRAEYMRQYRQKRQDATPATPVT